MYKGFNLYKSNERGKLLMILLERFKHDSPCWEAKVKGDSPPLLAIWKYI